MRVAGSSGCCRQMEFVINLGLLSAKIDQTITFWEREGDHTGFGLFMSLSKGVLGINTGMGGVLTRSHLFAFCPFLLRHDYVFVLSKFM